MNAVFVAPSLFLTPDFWRRIAVTLTVLVIYRMVSHIPLPGITLEGLHFVIQHTVGSGALERLSIMALGFIPWLAALTLAEVAVLILPAHYKVPFRRNGHADPFSPWVIVAAFLFTALQGYGIAVALSAMKDTIGTPGVAFIATAIGTYVGATTLAILLAHLI
jgi:preprotein translocase subunit SecY